MLRHPQPLGINSLNMQALVTPVISVSDSILRRICMYFLRLRIECHLTFKICPIIKRLIIFQYKLYLSPVTLGF
jgi:hypothetical protein